MVGYHPTPPPIQFSALEILRQRYARGEIDDAISSRFPKVSAPSSEAFT